MLSQISRDVPRPEIIKIPGLSASDNPYRLALEEILLGVNHCPTQLESKNEGEKPHPFWIFDPSAWLPSTGSGPEFIEGRTCFRFSIEGGTKLHPKSFIHVFVSLI
jgi:hypothetical protein